jgi:5-formyltetrahydrofolate cyclo-ligase
VQTTGLLDEWRSKKRIVLPVISGEDLHFYPYTGKENLKKGVFGISEPVSGKLIPPDQIDLFVVPGFAFDATCNRLGRGKGYYDRYLSDINKPVIGLCFDFQLIENIPCEKHDQKMTFVITESIIVSSHHQ